MLVELPTGDLPAVRAYEKPTVVVPRWAPTLWTLAGFVLAWTVHAVWAVVAAASEHLQPIPAPLGGVVQATLWAGVVLAGVDAIVLRHARHRAFTKIRTQAVWRVHSPAAADREAADGLVLDRARWGDHPASGPVDQLKAVIYVPARPDADTWRVRALEHVGRRDYGLVGVVEGGAENTWRELARMGGAGELDVVVIGDWSHLDPGRVPRVEAVNEAGLPRSARRRPRPIR